MLGECDSDHGFRTLDYWARERAQHPNSIHYAVLVAENLQGRYKTLIETLPQFLPFIGIELRTLQITTESGEKIITCKAETIAQPDDLVQLGGIETVAEGKSVLPRDEEWWGIIMATSSLTVKEMFDYCEKMLGLLELTTANSYISQERQTSMASKWVRSDGLYLST